MNKFKQYKIRYRRKKNKINLKQKYQKELSNHIKKLIKNLKKIYKIKYWKIMCFKKIAMIYIKKNK